MRLFNDNGYINIRAILDTKLTFIFLVGARAIGKTYGALDCVLDNNIKFIYLRRTQTQLDLINKPEFSPFKSIARNTGRVILTKPISKYNAGFYNAVKKDGEYVPSGPPIGYTMALSTVANVRSIDASDVKLVIYDEFIPEKHERPLKNEGSAFLNMYETFNRNRELEGDEPLQVLCMANANDLGNPIFAEMHLISKVERMKRKGQEISLDYQRGVGIFLLGNTPVSEQKKNTALYKAAAGSEFEAMAISNDFEELRHGSIKSEPIREYKPIVTVGEITFYKHRSKKQYYCTTMKVGTPPTYEATETDIKRFARKYSFLYMAYMQDMIIFEDTTAEVIYNHYVC